MSRPAITFFSGAFAVAAVMLVAHELYARQVQSTSGSQDPGKAAPAAHPPIPLPAKCPIDFFRELLAKSPAERDQLLADRPAATQQLLKNKISEYEALSKEERELRLRATELRWYLLPLLNSPTLDRTNQLAGIPAEVRQMVADHLKAWDQLPPEVKKRLLNPTVDYLAKEAARVVAPLPLPPAFESHDEASAQSLRRLQELTQRQRELATERFNQILDLTPREREKILNPLSETERRQLEQTLVKFEQLSPPQRTACIRYFEKFSGLSPDQRQRFLVNAERWSSMSQADRESWRDLVDRFKIEPPLPPGMGPPGLPPMPKPMRSSSAAKTTFVGTNE